jgi:hypothetical protein
VSYEHGLPIVVDFQPKEAEPAVTLGVSLNAIKVESLGDGRLHLRDCPDGIWFDVSADTVTSVHDKSPCIHALLRGGDEVQVMCPTRPRCVDECIRMEDVAQILPFASIAGFEEALASPSACFQNVMANLPIHRPTLGQLSELVSFESQGIGAVVANSIYRPGSGW